MTTLDKWLEENGKAVYGDLVKNYGWTRGLFGGNGVSGASSDDRSVYIWNWIWPQNGEIALGGYIDAPRSVKLLKDGTPIRFEHKGHRIILKDLPERSPDRIAGITVIEMEFDKLPEYRFASYYPQLHGGSDIAGEDKV